MQESNWWSKLLLVSSVIAIVLLLGGPLGYKYGIAQLMPSFMAVLLALATAVLVLLGSAVMVVVASRRGLPRDRNLLLSAMVIALVPVLVMMPPIMKGRSVPPIHDISTDTVNPPVFDVLVAQRAEAPNDMVYGSQQLSPQAHAETQLQAYPEVKPLMTDMAPAQAVARAAAVLTEQGLEVVNSDAETGLVEAVATSFWFGFKDDVVVRVSPVDGGSRVDVRSISRVGQSDLGANAERIETFLSAFNA